MNSSEREVLAELERRAARRRSSDKQVIKSASGTTVEWADDSELGQFVTFINQQQSAMTGVGRWVIDGRMRALAKDLLDLAEAADGITTKAAGDDVSCPSCGFYIGPGGGGLSTLERWADQHEGWGEDVSEARRVIAAYYAEHPRH